MLVRVHVKVVDTLRIERRGAAFHAVHDVTLLEQQLSEKRAILAGNAGDECDFVGHS
jgi:hypothetical protein